MHVPSMYLTDAFLVVFTSALVNLELKVSSRLHHSVYHIWDCRADLGTSHI